ncbi:MAG: hypothetical protein KY476_25545, partial [Planctomycetes bacterium]|nr:hypothetical protein [Planctomycetota bacterium]
GPFDPDQRQRDARFFMATLAALIRSPVPMRRALESIPRLVQGGNVADVDARVMKVLRVSPLDDTNVLKIGIRSSDSHEARLLLDAIIDSYQSWLTESEQQQNAASLALLERQELELTAELETLRERYAELRQAGPLVGQGAEATEIRMAALKAIDARLAEARGRRIDLESKLRVASAVGLDGAGDLADAAASMGVQPVVSAGGAPERLVAFRPDGEIELAALAEEALVKEVAAPAVRSLERGAGAAAAAALLAPGRTAPAAMEPGRIDQEVAAAEARLQNLSQTLGPRHPEILALQRELAWWQGRLTGSQRAAADAGRLEIDSLKFTEANLIELYEHELTEAKALDAWLLKEQNLQERIRRLEDIHQTTLTALSRARVADEALGDGHSPVTLRILEGPVVSDEPVWPQPAVLLTVSGLIGLIGGALLIALCGARRAPKATSAAAIQNS